MWCLIFALMVPGNLSAEHAALDFLAGEWVTESTWPETGQTVSGRLSYTWVLGGRWLKFTFVGAHPDRDYWEAHGMIQWDPDTGAYRSVAFWDGSGPHTLAGRFIDARTIRFSPEDGRSGIDYRATEAGVYQENWRLDTDDRRIVTLKTTYTRQDPGLPLKSE